MRLVLTEGRFSFPKMLGKGVFLTLLLVNFLFLNTVSNAHANSKYASLVIDADTGVVLHQENAGARRYPASLTKMMTLYLTFQALEKGKLRLNQKIKASRRAEKQPPSKVGIRRGESIRVKNAIEALVIKSANDVAVTLAEAIGGSEWQFAMMMNRMAKRLGMTKTSFRNASGLHHRKQYSNAYDMARLAVALRRDYPQYYHFFKRTSFSYKGKKYRTHNRVMQKYPGADGLKTGYIRASGFNLVTSVNRKGQRVVGVVMGGRSSRTRDSHMMSLLNRAFRKIASNKTGNRRMRVAAVPIPKFKPGTEYTSIMSPSENQLVAAANVQQQVVGEGDYDAPTPASKPEVNVQMVPVNQRFVSKPKRIYSVPMPKVRP